MSTDRDKANRIAREWASELVGFRHVTASERELLAEMLATALSEVRREEREKMSPCHKQIDNAIDAMKTTQRLFELSDNHILMVACRELESMTCALKPESEIRRETWEAAIKAAQMSVKKSIAAGLNVAAAEILIRRLENAALESAKEKR